MKSIFTTAVRNRSLSIVAGLLSISAFAQDPCDGFDTYNTIDATACTQYVTPDNQYLSTSGTYYATIQNHVDCDSVITINLTITGPSPLTTLNLLECDDYVSGSGMIYNAPGNYTEYLYNMNGCDSVVQINLALKYTTFHTTTATICDSFVAPDGQVYYDPGTYVAVLTNAVGCDSVISINVSIDPVLSPTATVNGNTLEAAPASMSYKWIDCATGQEIPGETGQVFSPLISGNYAVLVSNTTGCSDTSACTAITIVGLDETEGRPMLSVFPNPGTNELRIEGLADVPADIEILDTQGKTIGLKKSYENGEPMDISELQQGIYLLRVSTQDGVYLLRFVKGF